jgi:hypothetical protein
MINLVISLGGMEVDKMEENDEGMKCPVATQDSEVNEENKEEAIEEANYRDTKGAVDEVCGNCVAFNQTSHMMECMGGNPDLGYCQMFKFMCNAEHTCDSWAEGGPITDADNGSERDIL